MRRTYEAYLTVYLALLLAVMISLCLALIEGVRSNGIKLEAECAAEIGMNSIFAEYHRELLNQYNLFAIDSSYGTKLTSKVNTERHLQEYIEKNLTMDDIFLADFMYKDFFAMYPAETELTKVSILTDNQGEVFRKCAVETIREDTGLALLEDLQEWVKTVENKELEERDIAAEKQEIDRKIMEYDGTERQVSKKNWTTIKMENPTEWINESRKKGILSLVIDEPEKLSTVEIPLEQLIGSRLKQKKVNVGNMGIEAIEENTVYENLVERFLFQEYLLRYLEHYGSARRGSALQYQLEYLIAGKSSDLDNLKSMANRLSALREVANSIYIFSDEEKSMEAEIVAAVIATLLQVPDAAPLLKATILLGWAYAESVYDVKTLLAGGRVPLIKDFDSWHYDLQGLLSSQKLEEKGTDGNGLSYEDYFRIFMMLTDINKLTARAMDMVEADIRITPGNADFCLDSCYSGVEAHILMKSAYGYEAEVVQRKSYYEWAGR